MEALKCLGIYGLGEVFDEVEAVKGENAQPTTFLTKDGAVGSHAQVVLPTVQEDAFDLDFLLFNDLEEVAVETVDNEATQLLHEGLTHHDDIPVAGQLQGVDLAKDLCEPCSDLHLPMHIFRLVHEQEVLEQLARAHAPQSDRAVSRQGDVHVEDGVAIDLHDLVHLIMQLVQQCEREGVLR